MKKKIDLSNLVGTQMKNLFNAVMISLLSLVILLSESIKSCADEIDLMQNIANIMVSKKLKDATIANRLPASTNDKLPTASVTYSAGWNSKICSYYATGISGQYYLTVAYLSTGDYIAAVSSNPYSTYTGAAIISACSSTSKAIGIYCPSVGSSCSFTALRNK